MRRRWRSRLQSKGLSAVFHFVTFGCSSQSYLLPFHRYFTAQKNKAATNRQSYFSAACSSATHALFLRSVGLMHLHYRFISFYSAGYVPLHSSSIISADLYFFSGCSYNLQLAWLHFAVPLNKER